jgi:hypothetical protein
MAVSTQALSPVQDPPIATSGLVGTQTPRQHEAVQLPWSHSSPGLHSLLLMQSPPDAMVPTTTELQASSTAEEPDDFKEQERLEKAWMQAASADGLSIVRPWSME